MLDSRTIDANWAQEEALQSLDKALQREEQAEELSKQQKAGPRHSLCKRR